MRIVLIFIISLLTLSSCVSTQMITYRKVYKYEIHYYKVNAHTIDFTDSVVVENCTAKFIGLRDKLITVGGNYTIIKLKDK